MRSPNATTRPRRGNAVGSGPEFAAEAKPHPTAVDVPHARPAPERLAYRIGEVARMLGVSRRTIERELSAGRFPRPDARLGKSPLWGHATLTRWIAEGGGR